MVSEVAGDLDSEEVPLPGPMSVAVEEDYLGVGIFWELPEHQWRPVMDHILIIAQPGARPMEPQRPRGPYPSLHR